MSYRVTDTADISSTFDDLGVDARHAADIKADLDATVKAASNTTPVNTLNKLLSLQKETPASEAAYPAEAPQLRSLRFVISRITMHTYSSLTPDSKKAVHPVVKEITDLTPDLRTSLKKEHFAHENLVEPFTLPKGTINHGLHLGQQKQALGLNEAEEGNRRAAIAALRQRARAEGRVLTQDEMREIMDARKPIPRRHADRLRAVPAQPTPGIPGAKPAEPPKPVRRMKLAGFGWLGQEESVPGIANFATNAEIVFRSGDDDTRAAVLDKVADVRSSLDAVEAGTLDPSKALVAAAGESETSMTVPILIGAGVIGVGALIYYFMTQRK